MTRLSLRYKFLAIIALVLIVATSAYLGLAVRLFDSDKKAYIYDNNAALAETLGEEAATGVLGALKTMRLAAVASADVGMLVKDDEQFVALAIAKVGAFGELTPVTQFYDEAYLGSFEKKADFARDVLQESMAKPQQLAASGVHFANAARSDGPPLLAVTLGVKNEGESAISLVVAALLRQDKRFAIFRRSAMYTGYLLDSEGNFLAHTDPEKVVRREGVAGDKAIEGVRNAATVKGVVERRVPGGQDTILAYKKLGVGGLTVISEIPRDTAFLASRKLMEKSAQLAVLVLSLSFLVSIMFSRRLTAALHRLYLGTTRIAKGDFNVEVSVQSGDEVGALSASFNTMTKEIKRLLVETADKARMEKELETAQLVQDNFFPKERLVAGPLEVASFFKPASECGGDWWGGLRVGDKLILLIGDATGHGVPAALITAAAHSCAMTLTRLSEQIKGFPLSPAFILDSLNAAIYHAGRGRVKMTFFVAVFDTMTGEFSYGNASHEFPIILRGGEGEEASKDDLDSFDVKPDPCLGESLTTKFTEHKGRLDARDTMLLYTDGILECRNPGGEEYGERRLLRSLLKAGRLPAEGLKDRLVEQARAFYEKDTQEDDITVVVVRRHAEAAGLMQAG